MAPPYIPQPQAGKFYIDALCGSSTNMLARMQYRFLQAGFGAVREPPLQILVSFLYAIMILDDSLLSKESP